MTKHPDLDPAKHEARDEDIHPLALEYLEADEACKAAKEGRDEAKELLVAMMNRKGRSTYIADEVDVEVRESVSLKAKRLPAEDEE